MKRTIKLGINSLKVMKYILHYQDSRGYPPSQAEISRRLGFRASTSARYHVERLARAGLLKRRKGRSRSIQVVDYSAAVRRVNRGDA